MGKALSIGQLRMDSLERAAISHLNSLGLDDERCSTWTNCLDNIDFIDALNSASVCYFLDHVAKLEGFEDSNVALEKTRYRQLPWWDCSIWLPVTFAPPTLLDDNGFPIFLGSCQALLSDLQGVKDRSSCSLGQSPPGYEQMRSDINVFYRSGFQLEDESSIIQWIWKALHDGAQLAIQTSAPLLCGPG